MSVRSIRNTIATLAIISLTAGTVLAPPLAFAKGGGGGQSVFGEERLRIRAASPEGFHAPSEAESR